jgi:DNA primase
LIPKETIDLIFDAARVEEVVGDFVPLKKRGVNLLGNCPFHNEKTPSFTVSPTKGIYKCFGCGKAGNSVNFIMEHEHYSYVEALKYLARKYNIEIVEEEISAEDIQIQNERESIFIVSAFAQKHFTENILNSEEGRSIGLSYFFERGITEKTIEKFQLGYALADRKNLTKAAAEKAYNPAYLAKADLISFRGDKHDFEHAYDRFYERVVFPIHNLSGRVIAFGARTLKLDKNIPKYLNSAETEIYSKSKVLYGAFLAKKSIVANDNCYLVEGYLDVISLHQNGIENVVASSGTSLTLDQIRLIKRFTHNITILYDSDEAGIKATMRAIDLILEEGMNVKVVLFPDGEDPDSYAHKHSASELKEFIEKSAKNFLQFKADYLLKDVENDPLKKASLLKELVSSIAMIQDAIQRSMYAQECSRVFELAEQIVINEINKIRRKKFASVAGPDTPQVELLPVEEEKQEILVSTEFQEKDIIRVLLNYGSDEMTITVNDESGKPAEKNVFVAETLISNVVSDDISLGNELLQKILDEYKNHLENFGICPDKTYFFNHHDPNISQLAISLMSFHYSLSENWENKHQIYILNESQKLDRMLKGCIYSLKLRRVDQMRDKNQKLLKDAKSFEEQISLLKHQVKLDAVRKQLNKELNRVIVK